MLKVRQVKIEVTKDNEENRLNKLAKKLNVPKDKILSYEISKQSLDARDKNNIYYVYEFIVKIDNEERFINNNDVVFYIKEEYKYDGNCNKNKNIVIVGSGPAGLFCAYVLAENGYKPLVIERGKCIEERCIDVNKFWNKGILNENSNVQFGEGGAGTFSDGKLNTLIKDEKGRMRKVFETFVACGAPKEILYSYKPHIGTDILSKVVVNMRNKIITMGGRFLFNTKLTDINICDNHLESIIVNDNEEIKCDLLVLAIGHSARDTFKMMYEKKVEIKNKPFAVGLRVQHLQKDINASQYGEKYESLLDAASYKLTYQASNKRGVYSFCMCPGGFVVNASSKGGHLVVNGMSNHDRSEDNANSAIIVTIDEKDYGNGPLAGVNYQAMLEKKAYELGNGKVPVQLLKDYYDNKVSESFGKINPVMKGEYTFANLNNLLSDDINFSLKEAFTYFGKKINGFNSDDAILAGIESRTSSPITIVRDDTGNSNIKGIYPCGEGAGYAGGITSSAIDGIKIAELIGKY